MTTDPDKLLRIAHAHVTMATDLAAAIVRAGEHRAATLAAGGALDLADAVFTIDCLAAHVEINEAMLRATEGDYPAESVARAQRAKQRLAEALAEARAEARAGLERGDDPLLVHTRLKIVLAMAAFEFEQLRIDMAMRAALWVVGAEQPADARPVVRVPPEVVVRRDLGRDLSQMFRGRTTDIDEPRKAPGVVLAAEAAMVAILPSADGAPVVRDVVLNAEGRWSGGDFTTLSEDDGEP